MSEKIGSTRYLLGGKLSSQMRNGYVAENLSQETGVVLLLSILLLLLGSTCKSSRDSGLRDKVSLLVG